MANKEMTISERIAAINPETVREGLRIIINEQLEAEDRRILGDNAVEKVFDSIAYMGPFSSTGTFDAEAFYMTATLDLPLYQAEKVLDINKRWGVITDAPSQPGRLMICEEITTVANKWLLEN